MWIERFVARILSPNSTVLNWEMGLEVMVGQPDYRCPSWIVFFVLRRVCPLHRVLSSAFLNGILSYYALRKAMYLFDASRSVKCVS